MKRAFIIVLDSFGIGSAPDAAAFGDAGANTLLSCVKTGKLSLENMTKLGFGNIEGTGFAKVVPKCVTARLAERSAGKDTTVGHWEIAGLVSEKPLPTYPEGFPEEMILRFEKAIGKRVLCNKPYSGTEAIADYGARHIKTGEPIVYTSADSVFQIACHEDIVPVETLYDYCRAAREITDTGRVIARPFTGEKGNFVRTSRRRDFSLEPPGKTLLDIVLSSGLDVTAVGKITDIFAMRGITRPVFSHGNAECTESAEIEAKTAPDGLVFINLVDFDSLYGHRNDAEGYARALNEFDLWLPRFLSLIGDDDLVFITADHGCDPGFPGTDHTREYVPLLVYGKKVKPKVLGTFDTFSCIAKTAASFFGIENSFPGEVLPIF